MSKVDEIAKKISEGIWRVSFNNTFELETAILKHLQSEGEVIEAWVSDSGLSNLINGRLAGVNLFRETELPMIRHKILITLPPKEREITITESELRAALFNCDTLKDLNGYGNFVNELRTKLFSKDNTK